MESTERLMTVTRIYTGEDQKSHFEDIKISLKDNGQIGYLSKHYTATSVIFRETGGDYNFDWHNAPQRQYVIVLEGAVEITVGGGITRVFNSGDIFLAEDTDGQGHISRAINNEPRKSIFITID